MELPQSSDLMYIALVVIYLAAVSWYIISTIINRKSVDEGDAKSESHGKHHTRRGKRCPGCKQIIDARRTLCQHCGREFKIDPNSEPHPDELQTGRRRPVEQQPPSNAKPASS